MQKYQTIVVQPNLLGMAEALKALMAGCPVALPSETVYGLGGDAFNLAAIHAVFVAKQRPRSDPLIVHVASSGATLDGLVTQGIVDGSLINAAMSEACEVLIRQFWPGPLTLLLPKGEKIDGTVTSGQPFVAVRQPDHPVFLELLEKLGRPIVAPSANLFGRISPTSAEHVYKQLAGRIPVIVDGGSCRVGIESTIVRVETDGHLTILRPGGVSVERLYAAMGRQTKTLVPNLEEGGPLAPGRLAKHYAPTKPTLMVTNVNDLRRILIDTDDDFARNPPGRVGVLSTRPGGSLVADLRSAYPDTTWTVETLPHDIEGQAAAAMLFSALHRLDRLPLDLILVEVPTQCDHLWHATLDRLTRAASRHEYASL